MLSEETKRDAKSLAENLNLELRGVVQRALPEYFISDREANLQREPETVFREVQDSQRLNCALEYVFLSERRRQLDGEVARLEKLYRRLKREIGEEMEDCDREMERLLAGIRYGVIREPKPIDPAQKAAAPTNLLSPSKDLPQK